MKKILSLSLALFFAFGLMAQTDVLKPASIGLDFGGQTGLNPLYNEAAPQLYQPTVFRLNGRYMINQRYGIQLGTQYHMIKSETYGKNSNYLKFFVHGMFNLGKVMNFNRFSEDIGLYAHGGIGFAAMWMRDRFDNIESPLFNKADEMITWGIGLCPYYTVNQNWTVNLDYSYTFHAIQDRPFNMGELVQRKFISGSVMTLTLGVCYHFPLDSYFGFLKSLK